MGVRLLLFNELTRVAIGDLAGGGAAILPVGATEQHGPHLPTGTDSFAVERITRDAAELVSNRAQIVVTPTLPFGSSHHHLAYGGTLSLSTQTFLAVVTDLVESLIADGFTRILIVNGHGGNHEIIQLVARDLALKHPVIIGAVSYWQPSQRRLNELFGDQPGPPPPGHAGAFETSIVLSMRPELVTNPLPARLPEEIAALPPRTTGWRLERNDFWLAIDGYTDSPARGSAGQGEVYLQAAIELLADLILEFAVS